MASPTYQIKQLESEINLILRKVDFHKLSARNREAVAEIQQALHDARRYVLDFEGSEDPKEQEQGAIVGRKWLKRVRRNILSLSEHNVFSAIEVASLSAQIDQIVGELSNAKN